jgi:hypothetical protein
MSPGQQPEADHEVHERIAKELQTLVAHIAQH